MSIFKRVAAFRFFSLAAALLLALASCSNLQDGAGAQSGGASGGQGGSAVTSMPTGEKGKIAAVDNKLMFCVIEFSDDAMKELLGPERQNQLPALTLAIRRKGFKGPAGEFVGKVALRQSVSGKNFVIADIIGDWSQAPLEKGDVVFSD